MQSLLSGLENNIKNEIKQDNCLQSSLCKLKIKHSLSVYLNCLCFIVCQMFVTKTGTHYEENWYIKSEINFFLYL